MLPSVRILCKRGSRGPIVWDLQRALLSQGAEIDVDGNFGGQTERALAPSGGLCTFDAWTKVTSTPVPSAGERALQLTAAFEGHGYTKVAGNFDGAGLTWGLIGFTLKFGMVQAILKEVHRKHPHLLRKCFGDLGPRMERLAKEPLEKQMAFANEISIPPRKTAISAPWQHGFEALGAEPEVQAIQLRLAEEKYLEPAIRTFQSLGLRSEQGLALCFDIHVQNGSIKPAALAEIRAATANKNPGELQRRKIIATAVANAANPRFRDDVLSRKMTLATGSGRVHGENFVTADWGVADVPA
jgi:hypothetical protein